MPDLPSIFDHHLDFDPTQDFDALLKSAPARWVVYLLADANDQPVQLLCVKNLRYSLKRRLGGEELTVGLSKRVNYRDIVRRVHYRRVDSALESDFVYLEAARLLFPKSYQGMVGFRPAWFVHVDPAAEFPRYTKTTKIEGSGVGVQGSDQGSGLFFGPIEDKHAAQRLIELLEDAFDLCRYYTVLIEAPKGKPCAYKEMGRCLAPCDGSVPMTRYRADIQRSADALLRPDDFLRTLDQQMRQAAKDLKFELAGKIKQRLDQLSTLGKGPFRHARALPDFTYLSLQRGPRDHTARLFLITPTGLEHVASLIADPTSPSDLLRQVLSRAADQSNQPLTRESAESLGLISHHLFSPKATHGTFIPLQDLDDRALLKAWRDLAKHKPVEEVEGEGVVKELQEVERDIGVE